MDDFERATIKARWMCFYGGLCAGLWGVYLGVSLIHGHEGGGSVDAGQPCAKAVVDDFGTLVCLEGFR